LPPDATATVQVVDAAAGSRQRDESDGVADPSDHIV
jgi:hypothetical protein